VKTSSTPGVVECIRNNSDKETLVILDKNKECVELLEHVRNYLISKELIIEKRK
jgi:hypothetical protein